VIYADASFDHHAKVGGWGAVITHRDRKWEIGGGLWVNSSDQAELHSIMWGLRAIPPSHPVTVFNDCKGITDQWAPRLQQRGILLRWASEDYHPHMRRVDRLARHHLRAFRTRILLSVRPVAVLGTE
jgi:ribonuclease HI